MKKITTIAALLVVSWTYAQKPDEIEKIVSTYDMQAISNLEGSLQKRSDERESRVNEYLINNPSVKRKTRSGSNVYEIYDIIDGLPVVRGTDNLAAAKGTGTWALWSGGTLGLSLDGQGMFIGVWDEGYIRKTHVEFANDATPAVSRVTTPDTPVTTPAGQDHGTHVGGTIGAKGVRADAKGMASKALLRSFTWASDDTEVTNQAAAGLLLSNHSYGIPTHTGNPPALQVPVWLPGCYSSEAVAWDQIHVNAPYYLMVVSAGNNGTNDYTGGLKAGGFDKLTGEKAAKNNLVVANANPSVNFGGTLTTYPINAGSSQGPADDGRIKPDIAGDGTNLVSSVSTGNSDYDTYSGTSMAAPNVAGSLLLLQQHYNNLNAVFMRSSTIKALVCHTSRDDVAKAGPDAKFGWGLLNTRDAAVLITDSKANNGAMIYEGTLTQGGTYSITFPVATATNLKATICWTDPAGADQSEVTNSPIPALVNDLDLRVTSGSTTYFPWKLQLSNVDLPAIKGDNIVDTVESVAVGAAASGNYTITVTHKGTLSGGSQNFALIISGTNAPLSVQDNNIKNVTVWPNPVKDMLNIQFDTTYDNVKLALYDMSGRAVYQKNVGTADGIQNISTTGFAKGIYFLNIQSGNLNYNKKIIID